MKRYTTLGWSNRKFTFNLINCNIFFVEKTKEYKIKEKVAYTETNVICYLCTVDTAAFTTESVHVIRILLHKAQWCSRSMLTETEL